MACLPFSIPHWIKNLLPNKSGPSLPVVPWDTDLEHDLQYPPPALLRDTIVSRNPNREANVIEYQSPPMLINTNPSPRRSEDTIVLPSRPDEEPVSFHTTPALPNLWDDDNGE